MKLSVGGRGHRDGVLQVSRRRVAIIVSYERHPKNCIDGSGMEDIILPSKKKKVSVMYSRVALLLELRSLRVYKL